MAVLHIPTKVEVIDPRTGRVADDWRFFFEQLNQLLAGLTFSNISGSITLAQLIAHASTHQSGGSDAVKLDDLAAPDDTTDLDATTLKHGLLPKLSGNAAHTLRGNGTWA